MRGKATSREEQMIGRLSLAVFVFLSTGILETDRMAASPLRYLALGDSYTIGESAAPSERWPVQLAGLLRQRGLKVGEPLIIARTGWTVAELDRGIDAAAPQGPFDLVTLLIGVNDQYRGADPEAYRPGFARMLARAVALAARFRRPSLCRPDVSRMGASRVDCCSRCDLHVSAVLARVPA